MVRVFLPEATAGQGARRRRPRQRAAAHPRRGTVCRPGRRRAIRTIGCGRASATTRSSSKTPTASRRSCPISTSICSAKARISNSTTSSARIRCGMRASTASPSWCSRRMRGASAWSATSISGTAGVTPCGCAATAIGKSSFPARRAGDKYKYEIVGGDGRTAAAQGRPGGVRGRDAPLDRVDRDRCRAAAAAACGSSTDANALGADVDLRGASRLVAAQAEGRQPLAHLSRARRAAPGLCRRHGLHPYRTDAGVRASVRRLMGLPADRAVTRRPAASARRTISPC